MLHFLIQLHNSTPMTSPNTPLNLRNNKDTCVLEKPYGPLPLTCHLLWPVEKQTKHFLKENANKFANKLKCGHRKIGVFR